MSDIFHTVLKRLAASVAGLLHNVVLMHWNNRQITKFHMKQILKTLKETRINHT